MDSRERTFLALNFECGDRVPIDLWMSSAFEGKITSALALSKDELLDKYDVDLRYIAGPEYVGPALLDGADIWGVRRTQIAVPTHDGVESYMEVSEHPLADATTVEEIDAYEHWPNCDWFDWSDIESQCDAVREQGRVVVFMGDRMNRIAQLKPAMYLRGVEQILVDMMAEPELSDALFANIRRFYLEYERRILEAANGKIDILLTGDDFGSQNGPLISPATWERFLGDGFADYVSLAKDAGVRVMHHTCGSVGPIIPMMMDRGLDVLQSLQGEADGMDRRELKLRFGDRLAFHGGISIQKSLPFGTGEDVTAEVKEAVEALAGGGGYILCTSHNIQADTTVANAQALLDAYHYYGKYS